MIKLLLSLFILGGITSCTNDGAKKSSQLANKSSVPITNSDYIEIRDRLDTHQFQVQLSLGKNKVSNNTEPSLMLNNTTEYLEHTFTTKEESLEYHRTRKFKKNLKPEVTNIILDLTSIIITPELGGEIVIDINRQIDLSALTTKMSDSLMNLTPGKYLSIEFVLGNNNLIEFLDTENNIEYRDFLSKINNADDRIVVSTPFEIKRGFTTNASFVVDEFKSLRYSKRHGWRLMPHLKHSKIEYEYNLSHVSSCEKDEIKIVSPTETQVFHPKFANKYLSKAKNDSYIYINSKSIDQTLNISEKQGLHITSDCRAKIDSLHITDSSLTISNLDVRTKNKETSILIEGANSNVLMNNLSVSNKNGNAISILDSNSVEILDSIINLSLNYGILVTKANSFKILSSDISKNGGTGLKIVDVGLIEMISNKFYFNGSSGSGYGVEFRPTQDLDHEISYIENKFFKSNGKLEVDRTQKIFSSRDIGNYFHLLKNENEFKKNLSTSGKEWFGFGRFYEAEICSSEEIKTIKANTEEGVEFHKIGFWDLDGNVLSDGTNSKGEKSIVSMPHLRGLYEVYLKAGATTPQSTLLNVYDTSLKSIEIETSNTEAMLIGEFSLNCKSSFEIVNSGTGKFEFTELEFRKIEKIDSNYAIALPDKPTYLDLGSELKIKVPVGAVDSETEINVQKMEEQLSLPEGEQQIGNFYRFEPSGMTFQNKGIFVEVEYDKDYVESLGYSYLDLSLAIVDENGELEYLETLPNLIDDSLTAFMPHFSDLVMVLSVNRRGHCVRDSKRTKVDWPIYNLTVFLDESCAYKFIGGRVHWAARAGGLDVEEANEQDSIIIFSNLASYPKSGNKYQVVVSARLIDPEILGETHTGTIKHEILYDVSFTEDWKIKFKYHSNRRLDFSGNVHEDDFVSKLIEKFDERVDLVIEKLQEPEFSEFSIVGQDKLRRFIASQVLGTTLSYVDNAVLSVEDYLGDFFNWIGDDSQESAMEEILPLKYEDIQFSVEDNGIFLKTSVSNITERIGAELARKINEDMEVGDINGNFHPDKDKMYFLSPTNARHVTYKFTGEYAKQYIDVLFELVDVGPVELYDLLRDHLTYISNDASGIRTPPTGDELKERVIQSQTWSLVDSYIKYAENPDGTSNDIIIWYELDNEDKLYKKLYCEVQYPHEINYAYRDKPYYGNRIPILDSFGVRSELLKRFTPANTGNNYCDYKEIDFVIPREATIREALKTEESNGYGDRSERDETYCFKITSDDGFIVDATRKFHHKLHAHECKEDSRKYSSDGRLIEMCYYWYAGSKKVSWGEEGSVDCTVTFKYFDKVTYPNRDYR